MKRSTAAVVLGIGLVASLHGCSDGDVAAERVVMEVPRGAPFGSVVDTLEARGLVEWPLLFHVYARLRGADREIRAGSYAFAADASWDDVLDDLTAGRVLTVSVTVPEGWTSRRIAPRIARIAGVREDSALAVLQDRDLADGLDVPGPGLEGYLFPDTYRFAPGISVRGIVETMVERYRSIWTPERRTRLESLGMTERELVTLASIVQAEARLQSEMDTIAGVYHNRLDLGMRLEADPTVLYALGGHRERLLYAAMDSVADHPYNTYTRAGLPPGPIGSPGEAAIDATLRPADTSYRFFVARADGSHVFSETLAEHNRAVARARSERRESSR